MSTGVFAFIMSVALCTSLNKGYVGQTLSVDLPYSLVEKIIIMEYKLAEMEQHFEVLENKMDELMQSFQDKESQMELKLKNLQDRNEELLLNDQDQQRQIMQRSAASTYIRWGRPDCPANGTSLVYTGITGGSHNGHKGGAANHLCLATDPTWDKYTEGFYNEAYIYGTKYEFQTHSAKFFGKNLDEHKAPCAVCRSYRPSAIMIPGRHVCISGWTKEYSGYLVAGRHNYDAASEYICVDNDALPSKGSTAGGSNDNQLWMVEANCGSSSLRCPPYINGREITCVVCTK